MNSMTGFGKAELKTPTGKYTVEISSVNNRFLEINQRLPRQFFTMEPKIRDLVGAAVSRGKISIYVGFDANNGLEEQYRINKTALKSYYKQLIALRKELKIAGEVTMSDLILLPEVAKPEEDSIDDEAIWNDLKTATDKALKGLTDMRRAEGAAMARDMKKRLAILSKEVKQIKKFAVGAVDRYREKITKRLEELLDKPLPENIRIEEQIALMAEKTDITEECTRFLSHCDQYQAALKDSGPQGKKLNFILQEMNREANTIASKSADVEISTMVITIKEETEKIRELVQNVE
ncbi:MAG: YicC/YloC family endoribonuclease [Candidatus Zixiibacteriota bacterium]